MARYVMARYVMARYVMVMCVVMCWLVSYVLVVTIATLATPAYRAINHQFWNCDWDSKPKFEGARAPVWCPDSI